MGKPCQPVNGVHIAVRLVHFRNQRFKSGSCSVIEVYSSVTLVIPVMFFETNFAS